MKPVPDKKKEIKKLQKKDRNDRVVFAMVGWLSAK
jgi:hypothetical protein